MDALHRAHRKLLDRIDDEMRLTAPTTGRMRLSAAVREAMERVAREEFVRLGDRSDAYRNRPLPIGHGQTISQPFIVAIMTELLDLEPGDVVLEIGTGCGYETAVLAEIVAHVYSVEFVQALADTARDRLADLGYENVSVRCGDGNEGWPEHAPYDAIIVTAAPPRIPPALVAQLAPGGRLVVPVGEYPGVQELVVVRKDADGSVTERGVLPVAFVPLVS